MLAALPPPAPAAVVQPLGVQRGPLRLVVVDLGYEQLEPLPTNAAEKLATQLAVQVKLQALCNGDVRWKLGMPVLTGCRCLPHTIPAPMTHRPMQTCAGLMNRDPSVAGAVFTLQVRTLWLSGSPGLWVAVLFPECDLWGVDADVRDVRRTPASPLPASPPLRFS